jgi:hypothetical protein
VLIVKKFRKFVIFNQNRTVYTCLISGILLKKKNMIEEIKLECAEKFNEEVLYFFLITFQFCSLAFILNSCN